MARGKLTKLEKYWILYDVANSAFILLVTTIVPIYFNSLAEAAGISEVDYLAYWGSRFGGDIGRSADWAGFSAQLARYEKL